MLHYYDSEENQWESLIMFVNKVFQTSDLFFSLKQNSAMYSHFFSALNQFRNSSAIAGPSGHRSAQFGADTSQTKVDLVPETYFRI